MWARVRDDADWSLVYEWKRISGVLGTSNVQLSWELGWEVGVWGRNDGGRDEVLVDHGVIDALKGRYRFRYFGDAKSVGGAITAFEGVSGEFELI